MKNLIINIFLFSSVFFLSCLNNVPIEKKITKVETSYPNAFFFEFPENSYLKLESKNSFLLNKNEWGDVNISEVKSLLENIIQNFYEEFDPDKITNKKVYIFNSKNYSKTLGLKNSEINYPLTIINKDYNLIYLHTENNRWAQYSYQLSHELCHNIINQESSTDNRFGWFEESICELASLYNLEKMSVNWKENPPFPEWKNYAQNLEDYSKTIKNESKKISISFKEWISKVLIGLYKNRYYREENRLIAMQMLPLFKKNPELWKTIHYLPNVKYDENTDFKTFLENWKKELPDNLKTPFNDVINTFY